MRPPQDEFDLKDVEGLSRARAALVSELEAVRGRLEALPPKSPEATGAAAAGGTRKAVAAAAGVRTFTLEDSKTVFLITPVQLAPRRRCTERHGEFNTSYTSHMSPSTFTWDKTYSSEMRCVRVRARAPASCSCVCARTRARGARRIAPLI